MNFSEIFIRRPVATVLLTIGAVLLGIIAYYRLPIASLPNMDRPTIAVRSYLPGGSPDTIASSLTAPLESQLGLISGLKEMSSTSIYSHSERDARVRPQQEYRYGCRRGASRHQRRRSAAAEGAAGAADLYQGQSRGLSDLCARDHLGSVRYSGNLPLCRHRDCRESVGGRRGCQSLRQRIEKTGGSRSAQSAPTRRHACVDCSGEGRTRAGVDQHAERGDFGRSPRADDRGQ